MKFIIPYIFCFLTFITSSFAVEPLPANLLDFQSPQGKFLLQRNLNKNTLKLLNHFTSQKTVTYCGVASATVVLNASKINAPVDPSYAPFQYFTQENFFNEQVRNILNPEEVYKTGMDLTQLSKSIQLHGLKTKTIFANELDLNLFRTTLQIALAKNQFVIVNFLRTGLNQLGGGHHSPLAAYDKETDRFLLLDVARYKYSSYWVKTQDLWNAVHTKDGESFRGIIVIGNAV